MGHLSGVVAELDYQQRIRYVSPRVEPLLGYRPEEVVGRSALDLIHGDDVGKVAEALSAAISGRVVCDFEFRMFHRDGRPLWARGSGMVSGSGEELRVVGLIDDITVHKRVEEAIKQSEATLDSILRAAPTGIGLTRDRMIQMVNDRICEMTGYSRKELIGQSARMLYATEDDYEPVGREKYRQIREEGTGTVETSWRCKDGETIEVLLSSTPLDGGDLSAGVSFTVLDITSRRRSERILEALLKGTAARTGEDFFRFLVEHLAWALGVKSVMAARRLNPDRARTLAVWLDGGGADNGPGLAPEVQEHLFEPFFTTKEKGQGSGLGLSTVYGIVKQSGGHIEVRSEPGQGAAFRIYLPVVEDDEMVCGLTRTILEKEGYRVLTAPNAREARSICARRGEPVRLFISDVIMPGESGPELARKLGETTPGLRVLFMSGYNDEAIGRHGGIDPGVPFINKPFTARDLLAKVREVLDGPKD